jgi:hypothetical protein
VCSRALQFFGNDKFVSLLGSACNAREAFAAFFPALMGSVPGERHWNVSVNKMRGTALDVLRALQPDMFAQASEAFWPLATRRRLADPSQVDGLGEWESGAQRSARFVHELTPAEEKEDELTTQLRTQARVPALLSGLQYSDFVFGHVLGEGSYASVRYAKKIDKSKGGSKWTEYAIKVVDKERARQGGWLPLVQREATVMARLAHPNVTRLLALFENRTNIYLVLEYAHRRDLHAQLTALGSFDESSARFLAAEVLAGLRHARASAGTHLYIHTDLRSQACARARRGVW